MAHRRKVSRTFGIVLKAVDARIDAVEERFGDRLVATLRPPRALEVAAAEMDSECHAGRLAGGRIVDEPGIALGQLVGVLAARRNLLARMRLAIAPPRPG